MLRLRNMNVLPRNPDLSKWCSLTDVICVNCCLWLQGVLNRQNIVNLRLFYITKIVNKILDWITDSDIPNVTTNPPITNKKVFLILKFGILREFKSKNGIFRKLFFKSIIFEFQIEIAKSILLLRKCKY